MIWFVLALVCAIVITVRTTKNDRGSFWAGLLFFYSVFLFCSIPAMLLCTLSSVFISSFADVEYSLIETKEIVALNDNSAVSGRFFLGSGRVDEEMKYYFVEETEKGKYTDSISAEYAYVIESDSEVPRIEKHCAEWENDALDWLGCPLEGSHYKIYVPVGSVTTDFVVDLANGSVTVVGNDEGQEQQVPSTSEMFEKICSACGDAMGDGDRFCSGCGAEYIESTVIRQCTFCGNKVDAQNKFCSGCGTVLGG